MSDDCVNEPKAPAKRGRPRKKDLQATKEMTKREQAQALRDFRSRLLLNPKSVTLIEKLFETAFDDDHKQQAVAMKILSDRLLPVAGFTMEQKANNAVSINITGISTNDANGGVVINGHSGDIEDGDYE